MLSETLIETFRAKLDELGLELADLRIGGTPNRPLVQVRIEWPASDPARNITVDDCGRARLARPQSSTVTLRAGSLAGHSMRT